MSDCEGDAKLRTRADPSRRRSQHKYLSTPLTSVKTTTVQDTR